MKKLLLILFSLLSILVHGQGDQSDITVPYTASGNSVWHALLHLPNDYSNTTTQYPLIIFCHGAGEASNPYNLSKLYTYQNGSAGPAYFIAQNQWPQSFINPVDGLPYKFIVVSPQRIGWGIFAQELNYIIPYLIIHYRVDPTRIYLTGVSAGGEGVVGYVSHFDIETGATVTPTYKAAAIVPMSAAIGTPLSSWGTTAAGTDSVHVWGWGDAASDPHGENTRIFVNYINAARAGYGLFSSMTTGHSMWTPFYDPSPTSPTAKKTVSGKMMNIYEWMLQYKRADTVSSGRPPTADAGIDQSIISPASSVTLNGQALAATGHSIVSYSWTKISGSSATITTPNSASTTITGLVVGSYVFRLTVRDNTFLEGFDDVAITVASTAGPNQAPVVTNVSPLTQTISLPTNSVTLTVSVSDPEGHPMLDQFWSKLKTPGAPLYDIVVGGSSTPAGGGASDTAHLYVNLGGNVFKANDVVRNIYNIARGGTNIYQGVSTFYPNTYPAGPERPAPVDTLNITKAESYNPISIHFDYPSNEYDHMRIDQFLWAHTIGIGQDANSKGIGYFPAGTQPRSQYDVATNAKMKLMNDSLRNRVGRRHMMDFWTPTVVPGTNVFQSQYDNNDGVHGSNNAHAVWGKIFVATNIFQDAAVSSSVITTPNSVSTTITNLGAGVHKFMFSAFDEYGLADYKIFTVTVIGIGNTSPTSNAGIDQTIQLTKDSVTLSGTQSVDPDGSITTYAWTKISGPATYTISSPSSVITKVKNLIQGDYTFRLTVTDNNGATGTDDVIVHVLAAPTPPACGRLWKFIPNDTYTYIDEITHDTMYKNIPAFYLNGAGFVPGDTIVVDGHYTYATITLTNFHGSATCPIVFRSDTTVTNATLIRVGINVSASTYFNIDGTHPNQTYGFHVYDSLPNRNLFNVGLSIKNKDSAMDIHHVDIRHTQYGISMKNTPECDTSINYSNWWFGHIHIHHIKMRDLGSEGMYVGSTNIEGGDPCVQCEDGLAPHCYLPTRLRFIEIDNMDIDSSGRSSIQVSGSTEGTNEIHHNKVRNAGFQGYDDQGVGILLGGYGHANIHDNDVKKTLTWGIACTGCAGLFDVENNIVDSSGHLSGFPKVNFGWNITGSTRGKPGFDSLQIIIKNNILGVTAHFPDQTFNDTIHIEFGDEWGKMKKIGNQICGNTFSGGAAIPSSRIFVDPSIRVDFSACSGVNLPPTITVPATIIINLPRDSVSVVSTPVDPDGTINNISWTKQFGSNLYQIVSPNAATTTIRHLRAGYYTFKVSVIDNKGASAENLISVIVKAQAIKNTSGGKFINH